MKRKNASVSKGDGKVGDMCRGQITEDFVGHGEEVRFYSIIVKQVD